jgi:predicted ArsR family transcriptional regulator
MIALSNRILGALALAPMDSRQLAVALSSSAPAVCRGLQQLHDRGAIHAAGFRRQNRRPAVAWAVTRSAESAA